MDTSSFILSSNGANDLSSNNITSDNISVLSSLSVAGNNILSSLSTLNTNINNINSFAGSTASGLNITASTQINFNVSSYSLTNINASGLSVFTSGRTTFPFTYAGWYNISERLDNLVCVMQDTALPIITYDADNNTTLRIRQADFYSSQYPQKNYPKQIQFCDFFNKKVGYFNTSGLNLLDVNGNYNNVSSYFTQTGNSLLLCSNKTMIDAGGNLNVYEMTTYTTLGIPTGTGGTWLNVADTLNSNTSNITILSNSYSTALSQLTAISGNVANIASIANYYSGLQSSLAVTNGVVSGSGLVLAFNLKEDKFDAQYPLYKRAPIPLSGESFNKLSLQYNGALAMDSSNNLTINTSGFLTPAYGDLGLLPTPNGISSTSSSYVVVGRLSQPITCVSSLNVSGYTSFQNATTCLSSINISGYTTLQNATTCLSSLNVGGNFTCNLLSALNTTVPSILLTTSSTTFNIPNSTLPSILLTTSGTVFNTQITAQSTLNVAGSIFGNNINTQKAFNVIVNTPCQIGSTSYYRYDLDLTKYTTYITIGTTTTTRKFKFMCWMTSGAHNSGLYSLNYDIDYSFCQNLSNYNGLNALAYGFPYNNYNLNQITPNGLFIWKYTFNYMTIFSKNQINLQCIIIDYLN